MPKMSLNLFPLLDNVTLNKLVYNADLEPSKIASLVNASKHILHIHNNV